MSKIISISNEIYEKLRRIKGEKSYTMVIGDLLVEKSNKEEILKFAGRGGIDEKEIKKIREGWKKWSEKYA